MYLCNIFPQAPPVSSHKDLHIAWGKKWQHFACPFGALILEVESCKSKIRVRLLKISEFRHFCQIRDIPLLVGMQTVLTSSGQALCVSAGQKGWFTLHDTEGHLELEYRKSEKVTDSWDLQDSRRLCLSAPNRHAKCLDYFWPGALRICLWDIHKHTNQAKQPAWHWKFGCHISPPATRLHIFTQPSALELMCRF